MLLKHKSKYCRTLMLLLANSYSHIMFVELDREGVDVVERCDLLCCPMD